MPARIGYWVKKDAQGRYYKLPVRFIYDTAGNLVGMVDPYGRVRGFHTTYSVHDHTHSFTANACDYLIATAPTDAFVWMGPNAIGVKTLNWGIVPLHHSVQDIFEKRADVADYLKSGRPETRCNSYTMGLKLRQAKEATPGSIPLGQAPLPCSAGPCPNTRAAVIAEPIQQHITAQTGNLLIDAYVNILPPYFQGIFGAMYQEGVRQEMILKERLPPERYEYYQKLRARLNALDLPFEVWHQYNQRIYKAMLREAGLTEEEMLASSPIMPQLAEQLGAIRPDLKEAILARIQQVRQGQLSTPVPDRLAALRARIQRMTPEERKELLRKIQALYGTARVV